MSLKLLVIVNIVFKRYASTYCFMQGSCAIKSNFERKFEHLHYKLESQPLNNKLQQYLSHACLVTNGT